MDTSLTNDASAGHSLLLRVLVVAGALFGFTLLALAVSGAADASEGAPPARPGLLGRAGHAAHHVLEPAGSALAPVTGPVHAVTSQVAPVVTPVTRVLEPVIAPVTRPVLRSAEPVLSALRPVTEPVLRAVSPVLAPVVRAIGADHGVTPVTGHPARLTPRGDSGPSPVVAGPGVPAMPAQGRVQPRHDHQVDSRPGAGKSASDVTSADPMSGSGGGGVPEGPTGLSGSMSASPGGQHGGEFAVPASGTREIGTGRSWRAPPGGPPSLYWLVCFGNDHPS
ncbi:Uncharacterised protein [Amycolatopsis camponoti]|uniref:Uncharacterized protein n=1 Tax=Amycolatopsis camponoti TaxID=2606593 RepID=A0A6I8LJG4_9PSEU|nr:hypothetical protein [Amycolatopsis camponoti]VVJ17704.1 Uncharacterised protein [Amycolatopsis camponoti]